MLSTMFLKVPGIEGDVRDIEFGSQIAILEYSFGVSNHIEGNEVRGSAPFGKVTASADFQEIRIKKLVDKASPLLYSAVCKSQPMSEDVVLSAVRAAGENRTVYMSMTLERACFSSLSMVACEGDGIPIEMLTFNFQNVVMQHRTKSGDKTEFTWDLRRNCA